ncbi:MAG: DUF6338 family protein [Candidatus Pacebacteria bacterium]|nr:DUF6338 family protein [Candidatus Paceibacterota bacterium]
MSGDLIAILVFVMPGLVGAGTYRLLTVSRKMDQFDFVVFSFVLTVSSLLLAWLIQWPLEWQVKWSWGIDFKLLPIDALQSALNDGKIEIIQVKVYNVMIDYLFSVGFVIVNLIGFLIGLWLSKGINSGAIYSYLRNRNLTKRTGRVDIWQDLFAESRWIIVTDNEDRKYLGYAVHYSDVSEADKRELILGQVTELKLSDDGLSYKEIPLKSEQIYFKISDIKRIERY